MCGIYGSTIRYSDEIVTQKLNRINFRGPDFSAFRHYDGITLGHNRLSIIDLDPRSNQPFHYHHLRIVFNGEIYNYQEIRKELSGKGYVFYTKSDTEVICAAYLAYGANCVKHFNGMFAFVIFDSKSNKLFGARDRLGKKPFYYYHLGHSFEFASQISQINIERNLTTDESAIHDFLIWSYIPEPKSIYNEVKKLEAGCSFMYDLGTGDLQISKYWDLDYSTNNRFIGSYNDAKQQLSDLLNDAVKIRLFADVPLGVFLSGGIDSSLIASLATKHVNRVKTFSIKFNEQGFDESKYAEKVAKHLGTDHHTISCNYADGLGLIEDISKYYDEPFGDSSAIPSLVLCKYTKSYVTVALSGDAGDEAFLGYHRYKWINDVKFLFNFPGGLRKKFASLVHLSPKYRHKLIAMGISVDNLEHLYTNIIGTLDSSWLLHKDLKMNADMMSILNNPLKPLLERVSDFDIKTYLNGDINTKVDRSSMAFSLESRSPLMDYRVIEFSRSLPTKFKYHQGNQKRILKDLLYQHVPESFFNRPKAGFTLPLAAWFRNELKPYVLDNLCEHELKNIPGINVQKTQEIIAEHLTGKWNRSAQIWKLLSLSQWLKGEKSCRENQLMIA